MTRDPWYVAAWLLLMAGFGVAIFGSYVVGALLFVGSVAAYICALRRTKLQ